MAYSHLLLSPPPSTGHVNSQGKQMDVQSYPVRWGGTEHRPYSTCVGLNDCNKYALDEPDQLNREAHVA